MGSPISVASNLLFIILTKAHQQAAALQDEVETVEAIIAKSATEETRIMLLSAFRDRHLVVQNDDEYHAELHRMAMFNRHINIVNPVIIPTHNPMTEKEIKILEMKKSQNTLEEFLG